jgi:phosphoglycerate dehydrogenase-like enzyme
VSDPHHREVEIPTDSIVIGIASPLELRHVERIAGAAPERTRLLYRPDLLPPRCYDADHGGPDDWRRTPDKQRDWEDLLAQCHILWDLPEHEEKPIQKLCQCLAWVQTTSAGVGPMIARLGLADSSLIVTTASGVHAGPLAEFVFAALLFHTKRFPLLQTWQRERHWERHCTGELQGGTLAIVGPGRIGRQVARIGRAFGMRVIGIGASASQPPESELLFDTYVPRSGLRQVLPGADALVLCCPLTDETRGMIGRDEIALLKHGATLVNIARGAVIDESALIDALRSEQIGFAALDVFVEEPLPVDSPLWSLPNVLVSPHSASTAFRENDRITDVFLRNLDCYLDGRYDEMAPVLDKKRGY